MTYVEIIPGLMKLDVKKEYIDIQKIGNRRFMYCPATGILVLGVQYPDDSPIVFSHAQELAEAGITSGFDSFVRGWIGTGKEYPNGVIHFAPNIDPRNAKLASRAIDTMEMFLGNGALPGTVVRGYYRTWEEKISALSNI